jgi:hypothetical protein
VGNHDSIAYYISSHGYGHGVRSGSIIRAINDLYPRVGIHIVSGLSSTFLSDQIGIRNPVRAMSFDVGMVQLDSIRVNVDATLNRLEPLISRRKELVEQERSFLTRTGIDLVVADIPGLPVEAAAMAGIPRVAIGNFGWDWIYSDFVPRDRRWEPIVEMFQEQYAKADLLLRLPFCEPMNAFPHVVDIPLVAARGRVRRSEIAALTGCDPRKKWILLSFTTLDWNEEALKRVEAIDDYEFLTVLPLQWQRRNIHSLSREQFPFSDVIASADAAISKPGYGILSDCIVNRRPLIYADRSDFREYFVLEDSIRKYLKHLHIPACRLYSGDLHESLEGIWTRPDSELTLPRGGDRIAAGRIVSLLSERP